MDRLWTSETSFPRPWVRMKGLERLTWQTSWMSAHSSRRSSSWLCSAYLRVPPLPRSNLESLQVPLLPRLVVIRDLTHMDQEMLGSAWTHPWPLQFRRSVPSWSRPCRTLHPFPRSQSCSLPSFHDEMVLLISQRTVTSALRLGEKTLSSATGLKARTAGRRTHAVPAPPRRPTAPQVDLHHLKRSHSLPRRRGVIQERPTPLWTARSRTTRCSSSLRSKCQRRSRNVFQLSRLS